MTCDDEKCATHVHSCPIPLLPIQTEYEAVDTGEDGTEGHWETPEGGYPPGKHTANPGHAPCYTDVPYTPKQNPTTTLTHHLFPLLQAAP